MAVQQDAFPWYLGEPVAQESPLLRCIPLRLPKKQLTDEGPVLLLVIEVPIMAGTQQVDPLVRARVC